MRQCHIIQPGCIGDIIICLPIAKDYFDRGYEVRWYVHNSYVRLFEYVDYVRPMVLEGSLAGSNKKAYAMINHSHSHRDKILDLAIGFSHHKKTSNFLGGNKHFDEWKYDEAGVDICKKYNVIFNRNEAKEKELKIYLGIKENNYKIVHQEGRRGQYNFGMDGIEVKGIMNFTPFDWYSILKEAKEIYCVDSWVLNFVNQLGLCVGRRYVRLWKHGSPLLSPILKEDWKFL